ncbi:DNA replication complex GINS protein PSF3-like isoform X2 [Salvia divinorum]|uniref:DNA replication complex GINS protein PSF3-like isoform X2 n=1 Tax=Salvia divinorum TaxID=28513 RepID=A0ABD1GVF0_SALDI
MANYYDIDDILAEEELVPTVFQHAANGVGLFDSSDDADKVLVPPCFERESKTGEEIAADAAHVDLRSRSPYFYELGCKIALLIRDRTIGPLLLVAFPTRYRDALVKAQAKLYEAGQSSIAAFKKWRMGGPRFQVAPVLGRKRKPT